MVSRLSSQLSVYQQLEAVIFIATWISDFATRKDKWVPDCRICCIALKQNKHILQIHRYSLLLEIRSCEGVALIWKGKRWETLECLPTHVVQNAVKRIGSRQTKSTDNLKLQFHLFELSQSVSCLSPFTIFKLPIIHLVYHPKVCITVASNFSWVLRYWSLPKSNPKQYLCKTLGELNMVGNVNMVNWLRFWSIKERRTFGNLLQQGWFRSPPRYDHRDGVGRPENIIKANDQHVSPWNSRSIFYPPCFLKTVLTPWQISIIIGDIY